MDSDQMTIVEAVLSGRAVGDPPLRLDESAPTIHETATAVDVAVALPGVTVAEVIVDVIDHTLTIKRARSVRSEPSLSRRNAQSVDPGVLCPTVPLPANADVCRVAATLSNGLLVITFPKLPLAQNYTSRAEA